MSSPDPTSSTGLVARLIAASARNPGLTLFLVAALAVVGWVSLLRTPLDAIPDLSDVQVVVRTEWSGRSPTLVEDQLTWPISAAMLGAPKVEAVRGISDFGVSYVYVIFEDGTDLYWARTRVLESLAGLRQHLPSGVEPALGPDATGVGWVFQYALLDRTGQHDLAELRSLQDWNVRYALASVPGVAEVASVGGRTRQYQVDVDPLRLRAWGVTLAQVMQAARDASGEAGGHVIELAGHEQMVRARGWVASLDELRAASLGVTRDGTPVRLGDVAVVHEGPGEQRGVAELDGQGEVVGGIVIMRQGENALATIDRVKARLEEVRAGLPEGVELVVTYDRSQLIRESIDTLRRTLTEEMIVVSVVIFLFLLHARSALIPVLTLPVAVLLAFIPMRGQHLGANIMSLGGIAVAVGAMVDGSIVIIENVHRKLAAWEARGRPGERRAVVIEAMQEVGPSIFFSLLVMTVAFIPVFSLTGTEGRLFRPLAWTKTWSLAFASLLAITATPALGVLLLKGKALREDRHPLTRLLTRLYEPVVRAVVRWRWAVVGVAFAAVLASAPVLFLLEREFMPPLYEGAILYMPTSPPGMSVDQASRVLQAMDEQLAQFPEVVQVFGKIGRADTATDPAPLSMAEVTVQLAPRDEWRPGLDWDGLIKEMDAAIQVPGMPNLFWMPIQTRTEMLATGVRSPLGVQVFGDDLQTIEHAAIDVEHALQAIPGTRSATAERSAGGFYLDIVPRREELARLGLSVADLQDVVRTGIGGMSVGETIHGRERIGISVRFAREYRQDAEALGALPIATPSGAQVPLSQVAELRFETGPPMIRSEGGRLVGYVFVDPGEQAVADYVDLARQAVADSVSLPPGVRLGWTGQFRYYERARQTLTLALPATLFLVLLLLWINTRSVVETAIVVLAVPFSLVGAVWLLWALDYNMSVAVWVGIIALIGLDAETGVVMMLYLTMAWRHARDAGLLRDRADLTEAVVEGAARRLRPKLMTVTTTFLGLVPILWSTGTGADVMRRIAAPMVGGLLTSFLLELTVYPALFAIWKGWGLRKGAPSAP